MHDIAPLITSTAVIFVGILAGIIFNQRAVDKLESRLERRFTETDHRLDRTESRLDSRLDRIESRIGSMHDDLTEFYKIQSRHEEAIDTLKKRT